MFPLCQALLVVWVPALILAQFRDHAQVLICLQLTIQCPLPAFSRVLLVTSGLLGEIISLTSYRSALWKSSTSINYTQIIVSRVCDLPGDVTWNVLRLSNMHVQWMKLEYGQPIFLLSQNTLLLTYLSAKPLGITIISRFSSQSTLYQHFPA